jgi:uncharacterized iron-regulated protein
MKSDDKYIIYDTYSSKKVSIEEMVSSSSKADIIFFGEFHDDSLNHYLQDIYLKSFYNSNKNTTVSLEMFERDVQKQLDSYLKGDMNEEEFLKVSRPWPEYQKFYRTLVEQAKSNNSKVIAANIPRKYAAMYVNGGMSSYKSLSDEEKSYIAKTMVLTEDEYLDKFLETMVGTKDDIKALNYNKLNTLYLYYGAQCIKDETMAEAILESFKANPDSKIIHFNGDFHSNSFMGTVAMLKRRDPNLKVAVISPVYYKNQDEIEYNNDLKDLANYVLFLPEKEKEEMPQMMGGAASHFGENLAVSHNIILNINPAQSSIVGEDVITFKNPVLKSTSVRLLKSLEITEVSDKDGNLNYSVNSLDELFNEIVFDNKSLKNQSYKNGGIKETFEVVIKYKGKIYNPPSETNMVKRHANTPGLISGKDNEGFYLPGGSYYPQTDKDLATFKAYITLPKDYKLVTSGDITSHENSQEVIYNIESKQFLDELTLVGGKYKVLSKEQNGITFSVYYLNEGTYLEKYLIESIKYYDEYTKLFGNYPYKSFNIVENFFATGFGMAGYTLLSDKLMAMPWVTLSPGSLAHEFVHNWWGNSVFVDYNLGNWCEALTTFSTNYYYNIITGNKKEEMDFRRKALIAIAALPDDKNYPVNDFKYQSNTYDAVIGYSKGAMVFQEIMKLIGKDRFFDALKSFATKYSGKRAYWMNLTSEFAEKTKDTLKDIKMRSVINDWIKTKDIPEVKFIGKPEIKDNNLNLTISSSIKRVYSLPVTIYYSSKDDFEKHYVIIKDTVNTFSLALRGNPSSIEIDNQLETLRKIKNWEKPTSFNQVLASKPIIVLPDKSSPDFKIASDYVKTLKESDFDFDYNTADNFSKDDINYNSLILLGNSENNSLIAKYAGNLPENLVLTKDTFIYNGNAAKLSENVVMANVEHLTNPEKNCTIISFSGLKDSAPLNRLIHYQTYSLVLLGIQKTGRPAFSCEIFPKSADKSDLIWVNLDK